MALGRGERRVWRPSVPTHRDPFERFGVLLGASGTLLGHVNTLFSDVLASSFDGYLSPWYPSKLI